MVWIELLTGVDNSVHASSPIVHKLFVNQLKSLS